MFMQMAARRRRMGGDPVRALFNISGSRGFFYDFSDYSTQFTDTAGTAAVTGTGQIVRRVNDKSGLGNNATQPTADANAPVTTTIGSGFRGIQFDGTDDWLQTAAIDFSNSDEVTVVAGVRKLSDVAQGIVVELGTSTSAVNGSFAMFAPSAAGLAQYRFGSRGTITVNQASAASFAAPITNVVTGVGDISGDITRIRVNAANEITGTGDQGTGNYQNGVVYIGRRAGASDPLNGVITFLMVINRLLTADEISRVEAYANARTGAF